MEKPVFIKIETRKKTLFFWGGACSRTKKALKVKHRKTLFRREVSKSKQGKYFLEEGAFKRHRKNLFDFSGSFKRSENLPQRGRGGYLGRFSCSHKL